MKYRRLTDQEKEFINNNYLLIPIKTLARQMERSSFGVTNYMRKAGLVVPEKIRNQRKNSSHYVKGQSPLNKGKKQSEFMSAEGIARTKATRFQKGSVPKNHKPVGYERITRDGYTEIKVTEPNVFKLKHRIIFEAEHNVVLTSKDIIRFRDGNQQNFAPGNLYKVDNKEHLHENTNCDNAIAKKMSGKDPVLKKALLQHPELIDLKRTQYKLLRQVKEYEKQKN